MTDAFREKLFSEWNYARRRYLRALRKIAILRASGEIDIPSLELAIKQLEEDIEGLKELIPKTIKE